MIEQFPYPDPEHYTEPSSPEELLAEELRLYKDSFSMRLGLEGLRNMYQNTPIFSAFEQISRLVPVAKAELIGNSSLSQFDNPSLSQFDHEFFDGSIYALHAFLIPTSKDMKEKILSWVPLEQFVQNNYFSTQVDMMVDELMTWESVTYQECFNQQPVTLQEKITELAVRINEEAGDTKKAEDSFISGFLFSSTVIWRFMVFNNQNEADGTLDDAEKL